jgi:hypothetical protein
VIPPRAGLRTAPKKKPERKPRLFGVQRVKFGAAGRWRCRIAPPPPLFVKKVGVASGSGKVKL